MLNTGDIHEIVPLSRKGDVAKIDGDHGQRKVADLASNTDVTASKAFFGKDAQSKPVKRITTEQVLSMGITLLCKTRGHLTIGKSHPLSVRLHKYSIT